MRLEKVRPLASRDEAVLDELRLDPDAFGRTRRLALCKRLAFEGFDVDRDVGEFGHGEG